ncbi:hypothetical protein A0H81_09709 [Grifola frondosa]|uniref:Uncharacterized protein n=1 Tax=Grifola frondosa TaxID=5627 RepID=A0A1C7M0K0_GRIFR|nr:hypothetical protein A0H81_09709 [Grifola frondosa]
MSDNAFGVLCGTDGHENLSNRNSPSPTSLPWAQAMVLTIAHLTPGARAHMIVSAVRIARPLTFDAPRLCKAHGPAKGGETQRPSGAKLIHGSRQILPTKTLFRAVMAFGQERTFEKQM